MRNERDEFIGPLTLSAEIVNGTTTTTSNSLHYLRVLDLVVMNLGVEVELGELYLYMSESIW
jgi:hypothetical protein